MSRLAQAIEILEAIKKHFDEGADCVYRDGLILSNDKTLHDNISECLGEESATPAQVRGKRKKIAKNYYGNWIGFEGKRKVMDFGKSEEAAQQWLWGI